MGTVGVLSSDDRQQASDGLRNELIGRTLAEASLRSEFYAHHLADVDIAAIKSVGDLQRLPVLTKEDVRAAGASVLCFGQTPSHVQNTSGSTGKPLLLFRSQEEVMFVRRFFGHVHGQEAAQDADKPVVLALTIPHHGTPTPIPCHAFVLQSAITDDELLDQTIVLLGTHFDLPGVQERVSAIVGSFSQILVLTNYLLESGRTDLAGPIRHIELTGDYLTPRWREVLSAVWQCPVIDRYSLAEIFGGATSCQRCGAYHFDPHVAPELVAPVTRAPVRDGEIGELLMTSLSPFVQYQPFIRYLSGDLFERAWLGCPVSSWTFRGRTSHALFDPRAPDRLLINGRTVLDAVDAIATAARPPRYGELSAVRYAASAGRPVFSGQVAIRAGVVAARLSIELSHTPALFMTDSRAAAKGARDAILAEAPAMREAVRAGEATFEVAFLAPGSTPWLRKVTKLWEVA